MAFVRKCDGFAAERWRMVSLVLAVYSESRARGQSLLVGEIE